LRTAQNLHEVADTNLLISHEVQEPETGVVAESLEEPFYVKSLLRCHVLNVYALTNAMARHIVA
jgi:hypothetical protein